MHKPEDTSKRGSEHHLLGAMGAGGSSNYITGMEAAGQSELVNSASLPAKVSDADRAMMESWGFVFAAPFADDPLFMAATLPEGWKKEGSDHDMWSYVVDAKGRKRVAVFYKAAFYDRRADMHLERRYRVDYDAPSDKVKRFTLVDSQTGETLKMIEGAFSETSDKINAFAKEKLGEDWCASSRWTE